MVLKKINESIKESKIQFKICLIAGFSIIVLSAIVADIFLGFLGITFFFLGVFILIKVSHLILQRSILNLSRLIRSKK